MYNARGRWSPVPDDLQVNQRAPVVRPDTEVELEPPVGPETRPAQNVIAFTLRDFGHFAVDRFNDQHGVISRARPGTPRPGMATWDGPHRTRYRQIPQPWDAPAIDAPATT